MEQDRYDTIRYETGFGYSRFTANIPYDHLHYGCLFFIDGTDKARVPGFRATGTNLIMRKIEGQFVLDGMGFLDSNY